MSNIHFSGLDNVKMICIPQVSFKTTTRKRHVYIVIRWPRKWNQYIYLGIWEDKRSKIIFLPSFQFVTRLNSQNRNETSLLMNSDTLICIWILAFPIGWNIKTKCLTDILLTDRSSSMKDYTCHYVAFTLISIKLMWFLKFFVNIYPGI